MNSNISRTASGIYPFPEIDGYQIKRGDEYALVMLIQIMLDALRLYYDIPNSVTLGGVFDRVTEEAIREFQRINGIFQTGRVDLETWNRLAQEYNYVIYENQ